MPSTTPATSSSHCQNGIVHLSEMQARVVPRPYASVLSSRALRSSRSRLASS